jgi:hypothetical protein
MNLTQEVFNIIKKHLEFRDNWGNNPYLPKDKTDALLKDIEKIVYEAYNAGKYEGQSETVCAFREMFNSAVDEKENELKLNWERKQSIVSYFKWHSKFFKNAE